MVRQSEVAPVVPAAAGGAAAGDGPERDLRRSGFLARLAARAREIGFEACGVAPAQAPDLWGERLAQWIGQGRHGEMAWMAQTLARRSNPGALWPDARSVVMLAANYGPGADPLAATRKPSAGAISVYAGNRDYHDVVKGRLKTLAGWIGAQLGSGVEVKVFVDTAPVMEKPLAAAAGLGWQGKHTNLVSREFGSWLFLGAIFVNVELPHDAPERDHCGSCRACLDACPTAAFPAPYQLDARRCISYLTIEHPGPIPRALRAPIGNRIYGCDDCLAVCPWNKFAQAGREAKFSLRRELDAPGLADLARLDDAGFRALFAGGPVKRIGHDRFLRNVMIAIGNSRDSRLIESALAGLGATGALARGAAVWALSQLDPEQARRLAPRARIDEAEAQVHDEWNAVSSITTALDPEAG